MLNRLVCSSCIHYSFQMLVIVFRFFNSSSILFLLTIYINFQNSIPIYYIFNPSSITIMFHLTNFDKNQLNSKLSSFYFYHFQLIFAIFIIKLQCFLISFTEFKIIKLNFIDFEFFFILVIISLFKVVFPFVFIIELAINNR